MGKKGKVGKNRQDKFYHLAKEQGFRSRASFKLVQLNRRHDFLSSAARGVLDLCAAPGGWMQIARKHMPVHAPCIGIDLVPIRPVPGCVGIQGDITSEGARGNLRRALREANAGGEEKVDVVLNDGSPNMGKAWLQDAYTQSELTLAALKIATEFLSVGGCFITKVFRSNDYNSLLFVMNQLFKRVSATKPSASRAESAEIYVLCIGFRAPKTIDPRLLNPKHVFKEMAAEGVEGGSEKPDLFLNTVMRDMKKRKRNRGGYEDGDTILFKRISVLDYCRTKRPVAMMVDSSQFSFDARVIAENVGDEEAREVVEAVKNMPETSMEVLSCCEDLKVLARRDFKLLLKWRAAARAALGKVNLLAPKEDDESGHADGEESAGAEDENKEGATTEMDVEKIDEENINEDLKKVRSESLAKEKRKKRKVSKMRNAVQRKIDMKIILPEANEEAAADIPDGLFSFRTAQRALKHGVEVTEVPVDDPHDADDEGSDGEDNDIVEEKLSYKVGNITETPEDGTGAIEEDLDRWYKVYLSRKKRDKNGVLLQESKERRRITKRKALRDAFEKRQAEGNGKDVEENNKPELVVDSSESSDDEVTDDIRLNSSARKSREAALWFSQPLFDGVLGLSSDDDVEGGSGEEGGSTRRHKKGRTGDGSHMEVEIIEREGEDIHAAARLEAQKTADEKTKKLEEDGDGFEVVAIEKDNDTDGEDGGSDSSFHSSDYDTDEKAEMVAIGRRMRQSKKEASDVLDEAYNRYTFDDPIDLPRWFADPDPTYRVRQAPVTKEQVDEMKEYIKSLQAAPTKKEAEAKARRRARTAKKMEAMKAKATTIAEQGDVPASSRMKAIEVLYKQATKKSGGKKSKNKQYQVVKSNGRMNVGKNKGKGAYTMLVDRRLKADKRGIAKANERNKKAR